MSTYRLWTPEEDQRLKDAWPDYRAAAAALGRPPLGCVRRAEKLRLPKLGTPVRRYSEAEYEAIRQRYPKEGSVRLAMDLGRAPGSIVAVAAHLGVSFHRRWTSDEDRLLKGLHREKKSYRQISTRLDRSTSAIGKRLQDLGLTHRYDPAQRRRKLAAIHEPGPSSVETRWARVRLKLGEHGWPPDLNPKEIKILNGIAERGPMTRRQLAELTDEPRAHDVRYQLRGHGGRSAIARLLARRLLVRVIIQGESRHRAAVYAMPLDAQARRGTFPTVAEFNEPIASRGAGHAPRETASARLSRLVRERRRIRALIQDLDRRIARLEGRPIRTTRPTAHQGRRKQAA